MRVHLIWRSRAGYLFLVREVKTRTVEEREIACLPEMMATA
jgi:hypothetical protein